MQYNSLSVVVDQKGETKIVFKRLKRYRLTMRYVKKGLKVTAVTIMNTTIHKGLVVRIVITILTNNKTEQSCISNYNDN